MIEQELEKAVLDRIAGLGLEKVQTVGMWQKSASGVVKGCEDESARAVVAVSVRPRAYETFSAPKVDFTCSVVLAVRRESCPDGGALAEFTEPLFELLDGWQRSVESVKSDLAVDGFYPSGLRLDGGDVTYDETKHAWSVLQSFTVRGVVRKG